MQIIRLPTKILLKILQHSLPKSQQISIKVETIEVNIFN